MKIVVLAGGLRHYAQKDIRLFCWMYLWDIAIRKKIWTGFLTVQRK